MQKNYGLTVTSAKVQVELTANVLARLISSGILRGDECRCLDSNAKQVLWQSLLNTSMISEV